MCSFKTTGQYCLMSHMKYKHKEQTDPKVKDGPFDITDLSGITKYSSCRFCHYTPNKGDNLKKHLRGSHHMGSQNYKCNKCDLVFKSDTSLDNHRRNKHPKNKIQRHVKQCPHCEYATHVYHNMKNHINTHGDVVITCPDSNCEYKNTSMFMVRRHVRDNHSEKQQDYYKVLKYT